MEHELKTLPEYFAEVKSGAKPFEIRRDDRGYEVGHILLLKQWIPNRGGYYDGGEIRKRITYVLRDAPQFGLMEGFCILGLGDL